MSLGLSDLSPERGLAAGDLDSTFERIHDEQNTTTVVLNATRVVCASTTEVVRLDMAFGKTLKTLRERLDITQEELSERSGVMQATISALETRDSRSSRYAVALATALGVTVEQMQHLSDDLLFAQATNRAPTRPNLTAREPAATLYHVPTLTNRDTLLRLFDELTAPQVAIVLQQIRSFVDANRLVLQTFAARDGTDTAEGDHA